MVYGVDEQRRIDHVLNIMSPPLTHQGALLRPDLLSRMEVMISGWGGPTLDAEFLAAAPRLKSVFFGGGSVSSLMTPMSWDRDILVSSAYAANAIPVAEYTLSTIILSLKHGWKLARQTREGRCFPKRDEAPGCYERTVGLVSFGIIARTLMKLLRPLDLRVIVYDPFVSAEEISRLGARSVSLSEVFRQSDVVSIHTPLLPETRGMIGEDLISSMRPGSTLINTSRGPVVKESELITVAQRRSDLQFVLDVTEHEPPEKNSELYQLSNVVITPHIAGSVGRECLRMGRYMVAEIERYVRGEPLQWRVTPELAERSSHAPMIALVRQIKPKPASAPMVQSSLK